MKIEVTQEDIDAGIQQRCYDCPIARALNRHSGKSCRVDGFGVRIPGVGDYPLPPSAMIFASEFDQGLPVQPFTFELPI